VPDATERTYDGVIIGAGQHGLVLGTYLARAGLKILLLDRRLTYGGGLSTKEVTRPGFYHNLHSINHFHITETPWYRDLGLADTVPTSPRATSWGRPMPTAARWCSAGTWRRRSPI
jgi:phytoene dehydrogenase-like protein